MTAPAKNTMTLEEAEARHDEIMELCKKARIGKRATDMIDYMLAYKVDESQELEALDSEALYELQQAIANFMQAEVVVD